MVSRTKKFNDYELVSCFASVRNKMVYLKTIGKNTGERRDHQGCQSGSTDREKILQLRDRRAKAC